MPSGQVVASSGYTTGATATERVNPARHAFVMSNGIRVVIAQLASGATAYSTSSDGITWTAPTTLSADTGNTKDSIVQHGDVVELMDRQPSGGPTAIVQQTWTFTPGANTFALTTPTSLIPVTGNTLTGVLAAYDSTPSATLHVPYLYGSGKSLGIVNRTIGGGWGPVKAILTAAAALTLYDLAVIPASTSTVLVLYTQSGSAQFNLVVLSYVNATGVYTVSGTEVFGGLASVPTFMAGALDNSNLLDIVYVVGSNLYATKRTGTGIYSTPVNIAGSVNTSYPGVSLTPDGAGGLYVFYSSVANQTTGGEIYLAKRSGGSWAAPVLFTGGDAGGYEMPRSTPGINSSRVDVAYTTGTSAPFAVYYKNYSVGSAPSTPVTLAPVGSIGTTTPAMSWQYANPSAGDAQLAYELKVIRVSDSHVMWDSGKVTSAAASGITYGTGSNTGDVNYVAPTALSNGIAYTWQVRTWDVVLNSVSTYSAASTFTAYAAPTAAITNILSGGVNDTSSPTTIGSPTIDITFSYSQSDGNAASTYQTTVYQADGVTLLWQGTAQTLTPALASGSSFTTPDVNPVGMTNNSTYQLQVAVTDSVTGNVATTPQWQLATVWTPPAVPTNVVATPNTGQGFIALTWTNGGSTASTNVYRRPTGTSTWTTLSSGTLRTYLDDFCALATAFDYGVQAVGSTGALTAIVTISGKTLGQAFGKYGFWVNSVTDPLGTQVPLGLLPSSGGSGGNDYQSATEWDHNELVTSFVPNGRKKPIFDAGVVAFDSATGRGFIVLDSDSSGGLTVTSTGIVNTMIAIDDAHQAVLWRDPYGDVRFVYITNVRRWRFSRVAMWVQFDISDVDFQGGQVIL